MVITGGTGSSGSFGTGGRVLIFDVESFEPISINEENHNFRSVDASYTPDGSYFATVGNRLVIVWNAETGQEVARANLIADAVNVQWINNTELLTLAEDRVLRRWELQ